MKDKYIKIWFSVFLGALVIASGSASFFAQKKTFYKGLEPLVIKQAAASVLNADEAETMYEIKEAEPEEKESAHKDTQKTQKQEIKPPCGLQEILVIKNSQIIGCKSGKETLIPRVKFPPPSCESQGKITYTGEDRPGILYGMCINK